MYSCAAFMTACVIRHSSASNAASSRFRLPSRRRQNSIPRLSPGAGPLVLPAATGTPAPGRAVSAGDARHYVVRTVRRRRLETTFLQPGHDGVPPLPIVADQLHIEGRGEIEGRGNRDLERMGGADGQEVVHLADASREVWRGDEPTPAPARDRERLARPADGDRPVRHPTKGGHADVLSAIDKVLIDLVGDRDCVVLDAKLGDQPELRA